MHSSVVLYDWWKLYNQAYLRNDLNLPSAIDSIALFMVPSMVECPVGKPISKGSCGEVGYCRLGY